MATSTMAQPHQASARLRRLPTQASNKRMPTTAATATDT
jgi:hypothetical protein